MSVASASARPSTAHRVECLRCDTVLSAPFDPCPDCLQDGVSVNGAVRYQLADGETDERLAAGLAAGVLLPAAVERAAPTPLRAAPRAAGAADVATLHFKDERAGPTWSWKDRLAAVAIAHAKVAEADTVVVSSSGNHGAAVAAAAAAAGLRGVVLTTVGIAPAMRRLIEGSGGQLVALATSEERWSMMREAVREWGWYPASNFHGPPIGSSPFAIEGYKTIAWEIAVQLDTVPDWVVVPVGYGDGLAGIARGFTELVAAGVLERAPRMLAAETSGSLREALHTGLDQPRRHEVKAPSALSIACPQATYQAVHAVRSTDGDAVVVDEAMALSARRQLGDLEGDFHELSSAVTFAAIQQARHDGVLRADDVLVAVATSPGLKDQVLPDDDDRQLVPVAADLEALHAALNGARQP